MPATQTPAPALTVAQLFLLADQTRKFLPQAVESDAYRAAFLAGADFALGYLLGAAERMAQEQQQ